jgi:hypothetical protein
MLAEEKTIGGSQSNGSTGLEREVSLRVEHSRVPARPRWCVIDFETVARFPLTPLRGGARKLETRSGLRVKEQVPSSMDSQATGRKGSF